MKYSKLGNTNLNVSRICLGTMTWGEQNTQNEAFEQMDYALEQGVNFFDAAEMYPVPPKPETQGETERIIGNWFKKSGKRDKVILATKITGKSEGFRHVRGGELPTFDRKNIEYALNQNLKRLQTDYIDVYQLHWPDRKTNTFGQLGYNHDDNDKFIPIQETLEYLNEFIKVGKIRYIGLSNETPWGVLSAIRAHEQNNLPKIVSVQNPYSLLNRSYEVGLAEISIRENCGLLAYSPLAMGVLSGKYLNGARPPKSRLVVFNRFTRYNSPKAASATERYAKIAKDFGLSPAQMALAFVNNKRFVTSNIIGATTIEQLKENISSINIELSGEIMEEIEKVHLDIPNPCP
jgi:aryl-alcohol dehydrogenase-like predicted oxidoreductase